MFNKLPLKTVLIVPFMLQVFGAVGLVGYFSFANGRKTVDTLANRLTSEISNRIQQHVLGYLNKSHQVLRVTDDAIKSGGLDIEDFATLRPYFWQVVKERDLENYLFFGNEEGEFIGVEHLEHGDIIFKIRNITTQPIRETYLLNNQGNISKYLKGKAYDPRIRPWYKAAKNLGKPTWSPIFSSFSRQNTSLDISAVRPIFDSTGQLRGVLSNKTTLMEVTNFLSNLYISPNGQSFIMERSGDLVVSSQIQAPFIITGEGKKRKIERLPAIKSNEPIVTATVKQLQKDFGSFKNINGNQQLHFSIDEVWHYARVISLQDGRGIDWLIVVVIPENDFMVQINANTRTTIFLSIAALIVAILIGMLTTHWITQPILQINSAAKKIAEGKWENTSNIHRNDEVGELANSFNRMATQLKNSFETLEVQNEQLQKLDRLKDEFLANTSHELRTPLNGIIGIGEFLLEGNRAELNSLTSSNLSIIVSSARRLSNLVNDILDFSKIRHHTVKLNIKAVDLFGIVDSVVTLNQFLVNKKKNLQLINTIAKDLPLACADENRLQQILYNLIGNAIKFTESGKVEISAEVISSNFTDSDSKSLDSEYLSQNIDRSQQLKIVISDTGIGIPRDKVDQIFESFEQAEGSTARKYGGTGLGLAITKQLVELHEGHIWVESEVNVGSQFYFTLPISLESVAETSTAPTVNNIRYLVDKTEVPVEINSSKTDVANSDFHILIVDDEPINIQVLNNHLKANQYQVTQALDGTEALGALEKYHNFDLILLDVMMPKMSGYEVCAKVREKYPPQNLPILMLTAKNQIADLVMGFQFGANDYLTKPFAKDELLTRIKTHLQLSKITNAYGRFVPHEYVKLLSKENILDVKLGDRVSKEMAILFSDIRSFTTISEQMTPQETFAFVNGYLQQVSPEIRDRNGLIIKFMGDGIMAVFPDGADDAVQAAIGKLKKLQEYNQTLEGKKLPPIKVGIGIHLGHMMVGIVGEPNRMSGDALSDNVNLTSRLEGLTKYYGVSLLISKSAFEGLKNPEQYQIRFLDRVSVKGRHEALDVYEVLDGEMDYVKELKLKTQADFILGLEYYRLGNLVSAKNYFKKVLAVNSADKTARVYLERIEQLTLIGIPENWNGVWVFTKK
ncbi:response regulator [Dapis sp. BLCC M126]|uniref:response regulator n=1 Tax=Dapis sp. BLCC M126 TaxID=3400189 RepID=UPI003CED8DF4